MKGREAGSFIHFELQSSDKFCSEIIDVKITICYVCEISTICMSNANLLSLMIEFFVGTAKDFRRCTFRRLRIHTKLLVTASQICLTLIFAIFQSPKVQAGTDVVCHSE